MTGARRQAKSSAAPLEVRRAIGSRIRQRRRQLGWTQRELAKRIGTPWPRISKLEQGHSAPSVRDLARLQEALGMSFDELIVGEPAEPPAQTSAQVGLRRLEAFLSRDQGLLLGIILNSAASELEARAQARGDTEDKGG
jgi:transcriptional regulator with XRE-family HTH domain